MAAEEVLKLYDSYWFDLDILTTKHTIPEAISVVSQNQVQEPSFHPSVQARSRSLYCLCSDTSFSPSSPSPDCVLIVPKLETVVSGKEAKEDELEIPARRNKVEKKQRRRNKKGSRSLTDLEFEELKGFMDLGFVFSEEDKDSRLVSIVPGLQRYRRKGDDEDYEFNVSRPYLSEAWGVLAQTKVGNPLIDWRLRIPNGKIDMKDLLRVMLNFFLCFEEFTVVVPDPKSQDLPCSTSGISQGRNGLVIVKCGFCDIWDPSKTHLCYY